MLVLVLVLVLDGSVCKASQPLARRPKRRYLRRRMGPSNPFGVWLTPQDTIEAGMGDELAVVQIKLADNLWPYPTGKSAMVHYRVDRPRDALNALRPQASGDQLRLRFRESPDPHAELAALLARFVDRFGALPRDNQENPT